MSIDAEIGRLVSEGSLTFLSPALPGISVVRDVFVSPDVLSLVGDSPTVAGEYARISGRARAKLDNITAGRVFVFGIDPHQKSVTCTIARNAPPSFGVIDVRVTDPRPQVRLFGCVAKKDVLILLTWAPRGGLQFANEVRRCATQWQSLFPNHPPIVSDDPNDYFSDVIPG